MSILCKLGLHKYKPHGIPTKAKGLGGEFIYKGHEVCMRCGRF